jgi:hypothetical protein
MAMAIPLVSRTELQIEEDRLAELRSEAEKKDSEFRRAKAALETTKDVLRDAEERYAIDSGQEAAATDLRYKQHRARLADECFQGMICIITSLLLLLGGLLLLLLLRSNGYCIWPDRIATPCSALFGVAGVLWCIVNFGIVGAMCMTTEYCCMC